MDLPEFWVYVLYSLRDYQFYIGTTNHLVRRGGQHEQGETISTRYRRPFVMVYCEGHCSIIDARRRELYFKTTKGRTTLRMILRDSLDQLQNKR
jgi:putative endonuclease